MNKICINCILNANVHEATVPVNYQRLDSIIFKSTESFVQENIRSMLIYTERAIMSSQHNNG